MKIQIQFSYTEHVVPKGCRKVRPVMFHDGVLEQDIVSVSGEDAPVAIRSKPVDVYGNSTQEVEYRWYQGKLWTSLRLCHCRPSPVSAHGTDWDYELLPEVLDLRHDVHVPYGIKQLFHYTPNLPSVDAETALTLGLSRYMLIDGVPHCTASEPRYVIRTFGLGGNHGGTSVFADDFYEVGMVNFSLLDRDKALQYAEKVAAGRGDTNSIPAQLPDQFEVLIPEAIRFSHNPLLQQHVESTKIDVDSGVTPVLF